MISLPFVRPAAPWRRCALVGAAVWFAAVTGAADIDRVTRITAHPAQYERVDFVVLLRADWHDPFTSADVQLDLELTDPAGHPVRVPAFYGSGASGEPSVWHARFAPRRAGAYRGQFHLTSGGREESSAPVAFTVAPTAGRGFLQAGDAWSLRFDNGEPFRGLGENLGWEARSPDDSRYFKALHEQPRFNYEYLLGRLASHGGNFARTWMCAWNLPLEWPTVVDTRRYGNHPGAHFNPDAIARLDQLVELAERADVYLMLTLDPHGSFMGQGWELNPYNRRNGGPAATPMDFFTDPAAKARYRDRLRYLVARWGYSPHLSVWEFFNEVDHVIYDRKPERIPDAVVTAWHAEMGAYLRELDAGGRPVTTSISHRDVAGLDQVPALAFNQKHIYRDTAALAPVLRAQLARFGKPEVIGEYGYEWDWSKNFNEFADRMDDDFKRGLWLGLFSPTPILPMTWWWEYFDDRDLTPYFAAVRGISDAMLAAGGGAFAELPARAPGAEVLAVRCGSTRFAYVYNAGAEPLRTTLELPGATAPAGPATVFHPETRTRDALAAAATPGGLAVPGLALQPRETVIVTVP